MRFLFLFLVTLFSTSPYALEIYKTGNLVSNNPPVKFSACLGGGSSDDAWAEGWKYFLSSAPMGDVVIIRTDERRGGYEKWIFNDSGHHKFPPMNSVITLSFFKPADVHSPDALKAVEDAEIVFFAGGDQSEYIDWFKNSKIERALQRRIEKRNIAIGGTSAGMAYLAGIDFSARLPSPRESSSNVSAEDVLKNPLGDFVDLAIGNISAPFLEHVITDTHFNERNRHGRIFGFMARAIHNKYESVSSEQIRGIAADEKTAFCYGEDGVGKVYGTGEVYFLSVKHPVASLTKGESLKWSAVSGAVQAHIISGKTAQNSFDLKSWSGATGRYEAWNSVPSDKTTKLVRSEMSKKSAP